MRVNTFFAFVTVIITLLIAIPWLATLYIGDELDGYVIYSVFMSMLMVLIPLTFIMACWEDEGIHPNRQKRDLFEIRPAFLLHPIGFFVRKYGIQETYIYAKSSLLGIQFGTRTEIPLNNLSFTMAKGTVFGRLVFRADENEVVWSKIMFPEKIRKQVEKIIGSQNGG